MNETFYNVFEKANVSVYKIEMDKKMSRRCLVHGRVHGHRGRVRGHVHGRVHGQIPEHL